MSRTRNVIITGGAGGLGTAVTRKFLAGGDHVVVPVSHVESSDTLRSEMSPTASDRLTTVVADMLDASSVERLFVEYADVPEGLDVMVHLIGGVRPWTSIAETTPQDWDAVINLNLRSSFLSASAAMKRMVRNNRGRIVLMSAMTALHPTANKAAYAAAKSGVIALMETLAKEGKDHNIMANAIAPLIIRTKANLEWATNGEEAQWVTPEAIAATIFFLCSDDAAGISGTVVKVS